MIVLRWAATVLFIVCMFLIADGVREWLLVGFAILFFLVTVATYHQPEPEPDTHPDTLGSLDLLERSQTTAGGYFPVRSPQSDAPGGPLFHP